ncbi:plasmid mobilization protein, partial [Escherichia coli]|uniref:plasmid mobilization protein n=1 Tax=Escherichia coli TaxID=562 RepID=UPI001F1F0781
MKKTNKSVHVTFRLTEDEYAPFAKAIAQLDISKSEFFRMLTLNRIENYQPDYRQQPDYKRCLFLMNKTSNNLNQIAHRLNLDHNKGIISSSLYERALNTLIDRNLNPQKTKKAPQNGCFFNTPCAPYERKRLL